MTLVTHETTLIPDLFGNRVCKVCGGYGWNHGYDDVFNLTRVDCAPCDGNGRFREETNVVPTEGDLVFQSPEIARDDFGRYIHLGCQGGLRFFTQCGIHHWSCTSCKNYGELTAPEWEVTQAKQPPINLFANAKGADQLLSLH